jgi:hypothetical protein
MRSLRGRDAAANAKPPAGVSADIRLAPDPRAVLLALTF